MHLNPAAIFIIAIVIILFALGAYNGRKSKEWVNLLGIVVGVGALIGGFHFILATGYSQWTRVALLWLMAAIIYAMSMIKKAVRG